MIPRWAFPILSRLGAVMLAGYIAWVGWQALGPRKPQIGPARQELADRVIPDIVEEIRGSKGDIRQAVLLHFANDPTDYFTDRLRALIEQRGVLDLRDRTFLEKVRNLLSLRHASYPSQREALAVAGGPGVEGVLYGTIHSFESYPGGAKIDVDVNLSSVSTARPIFAKRYSVEASPRAAVNRAVQEVARSYPWFQRFFGWLIAILLLPVFTINFVRSMARRGSNRSNAFVLAVYTLADALLAWLLVGATVTSAFRVLVFVTAVSAAFFYNVRVMSFAVKLEEAA